MAAILEKLVISELRGFRRVLLRTAAEAPALFSRFARILRSFVYRGK